jgi:hypothetical protein
VEYLVNEFDDVLILKDTTTTESLRRQRRETMSSQYLSEEQKARSIETIDRLMQIVEGRGGALVSFKLVVNDTVYDAEKK